MNKLTIKLFKDALRKFIKENQNDLVLVIGVVLISLISFGAGRLTAFSSVSPEPIIFENSPNLEVSMGSSISSPMPGDENSNKGEQGFVASKNGAKYHLPWCPGAKRIKEEIYFRFKIKFKKGINKIYHNYRCTGNLKNVALYSLPYSLVTANNWDGPIANIKIYIKLKNKYVFKISDIFSAVGSYKRNKKKIGRAHV